MGTLRFGFPFRISTPDYLLCFGTCSDNDSSSRGPSWPKVAAMTGARLMVGEYASWVILACIPVDASAQGTQQPKTRGDQKARKHMKNTS